MCFRMQRFGDRSQPIEQRTRTFAQFTKAILDPSDLAEQSLELAFHGNVAVGFQSGRPGHVGKRAEAAPGENPRLFRFFDLGLDGGTHFSFRSFGSGAIGLQAGYQGVSSSRHMECLRDPADRST